MLRYQIKNTETIVNFWFSDVLSIENQKQGVHYIVTPHEFIKCSFELRTFFVFDDKNGIPNSIFIKKCQKKTKNGVFRKQFDIFIKKRWTHISMTFIKVLEWLQKSKIIWITLNLKVAVKIGLSICFIYRFAILV